MPSETTQEELALGYVNKNDHGSDGPIQLSFGKIDMHPPFNSAWPKVFANLGYDLTGDPISGIASGAFTNPAVVDPQSKKRSHAGSAYYNAAVAARPNLFVLTEVLVEKILIKKIEGALAATGVQITTKDGIAIDVLATTEVILAAGTVKSPQLLELSEIGDKAVLSQHGIETLVENAAIQLGDCRRTTFWRFTARSTNDSSGNDCVYESWC